jgi:hypothetical protein
MTPHKKEDPGFPSGPWTGFYVYSARPQRRHRMDLDLTFASGRVAGDGLDDIGRFLIRGSYDVGAGDCHWVKTYVGAHRVFYRGYQEGRGIWGLWELDADRGGFHIWPLGQGAGATESVRESEPLLESQEELTAQRPPGVKAPCSG